MQTIDLSEYDKSTIPANIIDNGQFNTDILLALSDDDTRKHAELIRAYLEN